MASFEADLPLQAAVTSAIAYHTVINMHTFVPEYQFDVEPVQA